MPLDDFLLTSLFLGLLLGISHALDADHMVAVGTLAAETESLRRSSVLGVFWGIGHTTTLALIGGVILGMKWQISPSLATSMEVAVAAMIVCLGVLLLWRATQPLLLHAHTHSHDERIHTHIHVHVKDQDRHHHHHLWNSCRKALCVGVVHGLAGSAALTLTVMSSMPSTALGFMYILLFGAGTIVGMFVMSTVISVPFYLLAQRATVWHWRLKICAGVFAVTFGSTLAWSLLSSSY